ncbi:MAG: XRE family transcriptional regulator [Leptolyngbya sp. PLA2]|nr:MAG: XRE family transcriptional regulator [Armatimonadota bacterium]MCE7972463.1 XRE family transcriptional regulator [Leptolyngbya sp. PL-A2]MCQ3941437.1 XRE family transcriptional regulator [cyanobacterium CYA1]MDL1904549.1 helix-turn-helix transcriptional regulator [Synechococcales cyanobacterium CNB]
MTTDQEKRQIIASRIREARRLAGLSQGQVAKLLGLQRPSVTEMEAGNRAVAAEELSKLAEIFDVSVAWLLGEGTTRLDVHDDRLQLAARELQKLKPKDLDRLLSILASMRDQERKA